MLTVRGGIFKFVFLVFGGFFWVFLEGGFFVQGLGGLVFCFVLFFWVLVWFGLGDFFEWNICKQNKQNPRVSKKIHLDPMLPKSGCSWLRRFTQGCARQQLYP